jgi:hypothetical protein
MQRFEGGFLARAVAFIRRLDPGLNFLGLAIEARFASRVL